MAVSFMLQRTAEGARRGHSAARRRPGLGGERIFGGRGFFVWGALTRTGKRVNYDAPPDGAGGLLTRPIGAAGNVSWFDARMFQAAKRQTDSHGIWLGRRRTVTQGLVAQLVRARP